MKIPKKLKINGHWFEIIPVKDRTNDHGIQNPASSFSKVNKIWIDKNQCQSRQESCLIHEVIEMLDYDFEMKLDHKIITQLETGIYQVLKDNKFLK